MDNEMLKAVKEIKNENMTKAFIEYYLTKKSKDTFGLKISKKVNSSEGEISCCEQHTLEYTVGKEDAANNIIELFARNTVTPITAKSILHDLGYNV